jgi:Yip1 domain
LLGDMVRLFTSPSTLFANLPFVNRAGGALLVLIAAQLVASALVISTRVPDYEISVRAEKESTRAAEQLKGDDNSEELARILEALDKKAVFDKLFARVLLFIGGPVRLLLGVAVVASLLFLAVALGGASKVDFRVLWGIVVFASCVELPRLLLRVILVAGVHATRVETSLAAFLPGQRAGLGAFLLLRRLDPFEAWYWVLVGLGLWKSGQMSGRRALLAALALALFAALVQGCLDVGNFAEYRAPVKVE